MARQIVESAEYHKGLDLLKQTLFCPTVTDDKVGQIQGRSEYTGLTFYAHVNVKSMPKEKLDKMNWVKNATSDPTMWKLSFSNNLAYDDPRHRDYRLVKKTKGEWSTQSEKKLCDMCKQYDGATESDKTVFWVDQLIMYPRQWDSQKWKQENNWTDEELEIHGNLARIRGIYTSTDIFGEYGITFTIPDENNY
jgi:hypothetical protein